MIVNGIPRRIVMNTKWIATAAVALVIALQAPLGLAGEMNPATASGNKDLQAHAPADYTWAAVPSTPALETLLVQGNGLLGEGRYVEAANRFGAAAVKAVETGSHADLTYALSRQGAAHRATYDHTGDVAHLRAAIALWGQERALYDLHGYPKGFSALAGFDLAQAYLALARHEQLLTYTARAVETLSKASTDFQEAVPAYQAALSPTGAASVSRD
jgi:hypothetical protein